MCCRPARRRQSDVSHAVDYAFVVVDLGADSDPPKVLAIGPAASGQLLEVIVVVLADERHLVIHAMTLRPSFTALLSRGGMP